MVLKVVLRIFLEAKAPGKTVEYVGRQLVDSNGARALAFGFAAHPIGDDE